MPTSAGIPEEGNVNHGPAILITTVVIVSLTAVVVFMRLAVRMFITKLLWWDDWTIILAIVGNIIGGALDGVEVHYGFGRPAYYLDEWQIIEFRKYTYGEWIQTFFTLMWTKVSICFFLLRIPVTKGLIRPLQAAIVFLLVSNVILTVLWIVQCRPLNGAWNPYVEATCFGKGQIERIIISQAIISIISDFVFSAYPILILWNVQIKFRQKVALCCLMGVGIFTGACCLVRTVLNYQVVPADPTFGGVTNWFWRTFEVQIGLIAASIPALAPGFRWLSEKTSSQSKSKGHLLTDTEGVRNAMGTSKKTSKKVSSDDSQVEMDFRMDPEQIHPV